MHKNIILVFRFVIISSAVAMLSVIFFIVFLAYLINNPNDKYKWNRDKELKPNIVPNDAYYIGGEDGGHWIKLHSLRRDTCRFHIYRDYNGKLILDADFIYTVRYREQLTKNIWINCGGCWVNDELLVDFPKCDGSYDCILVPVEPVYYCEDSCYESLWIGNSDGQLQY